MSSIARGAFTVEIKPQAHPSSPDRVTLGRMLLDKRFEGDLVATGKGEMLTAITGVEGSAGYVALERVAGTLHGRSGSFVFHHSGTMNRGELELSITVVPDSGIEGLTGLSGTLKVSQADGKHFYEFDYALPQRSS